MVLFKRFVQINPLLFLSTTILLYILRMVGPYVNYVFIPFLFFYFLFTSYHLLKQCKSINYFEVIKFNFYLILISILFLWGFIISSTFIFPVFKELLNVVIILFLSFSLFIFVKNKESFNKFNKIFCKQFIFFSSIISILGLTKFYFQLKGIEFSFLNYSKQIDGTSLATDNNFYIVFSFIGIIAIIFGLRYFKDKTYFSNNKIISFLLLILSLNVLFSYSRRGFFLLLLMILCSVFFIIIGYRKKSNSFFVVSTWFAFFLFFILLLSGFLFITPVQMKRNTLNFLGISVKSYKYVSSTLLYKYSTIFSDHEYSHFQDIVWLENPDSLNPDSGWGSQVSARIFPLIGENVKIVPENSIGYKMDKTCDASTWEDNAYSFTNISNLFMGDSITENNEFFYSSVYCYVSKDFNGTWARISAGGEVSGNVLKEYDLSKKGVWQKLSICFKSTGNISPVYLFWAKNGVIDFYNLKGYIIFANPEYRIIKADPKDPDTGWGSKISTQAFPLFGENVKIVPENSIGYKMDNTSNASTWSNNVYSYTNISSLFQGDSITANNEFYYASVYCFVSKDFDGSWARISAEGGASGKIVHEYDFNKKGVWQKLSIYFKNNGNISPVYLYWAKNGVTDFSNLKGHIIFAYPEYRVTIINTDPKDPATGWGSRISTLTFPLSGENVKIVPENSIGYKMDNTSNASTWNNNAYSYTNISSLFQGDSITANNEFYFASVYCFVSDDFDGTWVRISAEGEVSGNVLKEYDLSKKGTWQKLQIDFTAKSGIPPVYLYWSKYGVIDFKNLKGFVIYAYPEYYKKTSKADL